MDSCVCSFSRNFKRLVVVLVSFSVSSEESFGVSCPLSGAAASRDIVVQIVLESEVQLIEEKIRCPESQFSRSAEVPSRVRKRRLRTEADTA